MTLKKRLSKTINGGEMRKTDEARENFIARWRRRQGCRNMEKICWCEACRELEAIWDKEKKEAIKTAISALERHAADRNYIKKDVINHVINILKKEGAV